MDESTRVGFGVMIMIMIFLFGGVYMSMEHDKQQQQQIVELIKQGVDPLKASCIVVRTTLACEKVK